MMRKSRISMRRVSAYFNWTQTPCDMITRGLIRRKETRVTTRLLLPQLQDPSRAQIGDVNPSEAIPFHPKGGYKLHSNNSKYQESIYEPVMILFR
jgi:hypothetical protein